MFSRVLYAIGAARVTRQGVPAAVKGGHARGLNSRLTLEEPRRGLCSGRRCASLGFPPICAAQGHGGERLITGPRPCAGPANMRRGSAQSLPGPMGFRTPMGRAGRRACAPWTEKGRRLSRSPGRIATRGHGTRGPRRCRTRGGAAHFVDCGELSAGQV